MGCGASAPAAHVPHVAGRTIAEEYRTNNKGAAAAGARFELNAQSVLQTGDLVLVPGQVQATNPATVIGAGEVVSGGGGERVIPVVETVPMQFDIRHLTRIGRSTGDKKVQQQIGKLEVDHNMQNRPLTGDIICVLTVGDVVDTPRGLSMVVGPTGSDGMLKVSGLEEVMLANGSKSVQVKQRSVAPSSVRKVGSVQIAPGGVFPAPPPCGSVDDPNRPLQKGACEVRPGDICDSVHGHVLVTTVPKSPDWKIGGTLRIQRSYPVSRLTLVGGPTFESRGNPDGATYAVGFASNVAYEQRRQQAALQEVIKLRSVADNGVSLFFLDKFVSSPTFDAGWSTEDVVKQHTAFVNIAVRTNSRYTDVMPQEHVGKPTYFVSHCWRDNAKLLVEQLKDFVEKKHQKEKDSSGGEWAGKTKEEVYATTYFWIDIFAVNQGVGNATDMADVNANLARSVQQTKNGTLVMFGSDGTPLTRVWCLYELLVSWAAGNVEKPVRILFAPPSTPIDIDSSAWNDLSVTAAQATKAADKQMILERIQDIERRTGRNFDSDLRDKLLSQIKDDYNIAFLEFAVKTKQKWFLYQKAAQKLVLFYQVLGNFEAAGAIATSCTECPEPDEDEDVYKKEEEKSPTMKRCEPLLLAKQYALLGQVLRKQGDKMRAESGGRGEVNLNLSNSQLETLAAVQQTYRRAVTALRQAMEESTKVDSSVHQSWPSRALNVSVLTTLGMLFHTLQIFDQRDQTFSHSSDQLLLMLHDARINWTDQPWIGSLNLTKVEMRDTTNETGRAAEAPPDRPGVDTNKALAAEIALQAHKLLRFVEKDFNLKRGINLNRWNPLLKDNFNPGSANNWCNNLNSLHWINVGLLCLQSNQVDRAGSSMLDAVIASKKYNDPTPYLAMSCLYMGVSTSWLDLEAPDTDGFAGIKNKPPAQVPAAFSIDKQLYPIDAHLKESWVNWVQVIPQSHPSWLLINAILSNWNQELLWSKFAAASWVVMPETTILKPHTRSTHPQGQAGIDAENSVPLFPLLGVEYQSLTPGTAYNYGSAIMQQIAETGKDCIATRWMADLKTVKPTWHNRMKGQRQTLQNEVNALIQKRVREYQDYCNRFGVQPDFACLHYNDLANLLVQAGAFVEAIKTLELAIKFAKDLPSPSPKDNNGRVLLLNDKLPSEALLGLSLFNLAFVKFFHLRTGMRLNAALEPNQSQVNVQAAANSAIENQLNRALEHSVAARVVNESRVRAGVHLESNDAEAKALFGEAEKLWQAVLGEEHPAWMLINSLLTMRLVGMLRIARDQATSKLFPLHQFRVNAGDFNGPRRIDVRDPRYKGERRRIVTFLDAFLQTERFQEPVRRAMHGM